MNGFEIQSDVDALQERQQELLKNLDARPTKTPRKYEELSPLDFLQNLFFCLLLSCVLIFVSP